ncbi:hypothetical protein MA16_Dca019271 [Dendrobium catenatum]|uniref:Uncharacterized protein n=1 Tax=Dendrobium catenatum TaxID=906689 RepID=A0A2I0WBN6_9ASPA|nr:hypothetical protein MA16_Dca019271 [Dendrobium catenatum]
MLHFLNHTKLELEEWYGITKEDFCWYMVIHVLIGILEILNYFLFDSSELCSKIGCMSIKV